LTEERLQAALTKLRAQHTKMFERLGNLQKQGIVDGSVNSGHFNIAKGNVAEVLSEDIQDIALAEVRKIHPDAELITGVKIRLRDFDLPDQDGRDIPDEGGNLSDTKLFTDNLIGVYRGDSLAVYGKFEVKSGPRGGDGASL
jgi:hypothetical protein